jgi:hypothetical protein
LSRRRWIGASLIGRSSSPYTYRGVGRYLLLGNSGPRCHAWYIRRAFLVEFWPYDDEGILLGEYAAEMGPPEIIPIDDSEVITFQEARDALTPLLRPLSAYAD